jgi:hypothetical protein
MKMHLPYNEAVQLKKLFERTLVVNYATSEEIRAFEELVKKINWLVVEKE